MRPDSYPSPCTKANSKRIQELSIRHETLKLLEENTEEMLQDIGIGNNFFFIRPQKPQETNAKTDRRDFIKLKSFCTVKV